jgi:putative membrane protein insertion efficiency factor
VCKELAVSPKMSKIIVSAIGLYRRFISPMLPASCRYWPTCSDYTLQAVQKHGVLKGLMMGAWRVARCNPLSKGGIDPVK